MNVLEFTQSEKRDQEKEGQRAGVTQFTSASATAAHTKCYFIQISFPRFKIHTGTMQWCECSQHKNNTHKTESNNSEQHECA